jgi:hypothetical protein
MLSSFRSSRVIARRGVSPAGAILELWLSEFSQNAGVLLHRRCFECQHTQIHSSGELLSEITGQVPFRQLSWACVKSKRLRAIETILKISRLCISIETPLLAQSAEVGIEQRQDIERQKRCGNQSTNHNSGERLLNLSSAGCGECHGNKTQAGDERRDQNRTETIGCTLMHGLIQIFTLLPDAGHGRPPRDCQPC